MTDMTPPPPGYIERETRRLVAEYARLRQIEREYGAKSPEAAMQRTSIAGQEQDLETARQAAKAAGGARD